MPETEQLPTYRQCVQRLKTLAKERSEWAGMPMLMDGYNLVLEPKFPYQFDKPELRVCRNSDVNEAELGDQIVNAWWCDKLMAEVLVVRNGKGKLEALVKYEGRGGMLGRGLIDNLALTNIWLMEAELKAMAKLKAMVRPHTFDAYLMTGTFLETSKRSKVTYLFRRLRPTLAMSGSTGTMRILCALCLHPIGYYEGTHAGVMVPTDEVIAHLAYMRGDEHAYWKQSNQHQPNRPNAGL